MAGPDTGTARGRSGGADGDRTRGLDNAIVALSQLSYCPMRMAIRRVTIACPTPECQSTHRLEEREAVTVVGQLFEKCLALPKAEKVPGTWEIDPVPPSPADCPARPARDKILALMRLGVHVPMSGGLAAALQWARRCRCTTMQIFSRSPRGGPASALDPALVDAFTRGRHAADIDPLVVHAPYIINLASPDAVTWRNSVRLFREEVERAGAFKARYLVVHMGTPREAGEAAGVARVAAALEQTVAADGPVTVLLENSAGSGRGFGDRFEQLAAIRAAVSRPDRVGVCLRSEERRVGKEG